MEMLPKPYGRSQPDGQENLGKTVGGGRIDISNCRGLAYRGRMVRVCGEPGKNMDLQWRIVAAAADHPSDWISDLYKRISGAGPICG